MPTPIPVESYPLLMDLVNQTYLDRVEQITAAQVNDDDSITFVGLDNPKKIAGKITDNDISMKLVTTGQKPQFAAPKKKPKNCSSPTSISCGLTCLPAKTKAGKDTVCKKPLSPNQKAQKKSIVESAKSSKDKASVDSLKPNSTPLSKNKESVQFTHQSITSQELKKAWEKQLAANEYETKRLQLAAETDEFAKSILKEGMDRRKNSAIKNIGKPLHDLETIQDNSNIVFGLTAINSPTIGVMNNGQIAAAFTYEEAKGAKPLYIHFLATSPNNMFSGTNPIKGAGRAAIKAMVAESLRQGKKGAVKLTPIPGAVDFYKKMGFKSGRDGDMTLTAEAAKQHL
jgi:hypothetical protein